MSRSFTHSPFCPRFRAREPHPAHDLGDRYMTVRYGKVERWCLGYGDGPGTIEIIKPGSPEALPIWRRRDHS